MVPELSIIVPVFNIKNYLTDCVESILAQSFKNFELILVDDGSSDGSSELCDEYKEKDTRIIVIHQKNSGVSIARNKGVSIARGKWIGFVDGDDWIEPDTYQKSLQKANEIAADVIQWNLYYENNNTKKRLISNEIPEGVMLFEKEIDYPWWIAVVWNKIFKRDLIVKNQIIFPEGIAVSEDTQFAFLAYANSNRVYMMQDCFYHYRIREDSAVNTMTIQKIENKVEAISNLEFLLKKIGKDDNFYTILKTKKINAKNSYILSLDKPNYQKWRDTYPELTKEIINKGTRKSSIIFKLAYYRLYIIADFFCMIRRKGKK